MFLWFRETITLKDYPGSVASKDMGVLFVTPLLGDRMPYSNFDVHQISKVYIHAGRQILTDKTQ